MSSSHESEISQQDLDKLQTNNNDNLFKQNLDELTQDSPISIIEVNNNVYENDIFEYNNDIINNYYKNKQMYKNKLNSNIEQFSNEILQRNYDKNTLVNHILKYVEQFEQNICKPFDKIFQFTSYLYNKDFKYTCKKYKNVSSNIQKRIYNGLFQNAQQKNDKQSQKIANEIQYKREIMELVQEILQSDISNQNLNSLYTKYPNNTIQIQFISPLISVFKEMATLFTTLNQMNQKLAQLNVYKNLSKNEFYNHFQKIINSNTILDNYLNKLQTNWNNSILKSILTFSEFKFPKKDIKQNNYELQNIIKQITPKNYVFAYSIQKQAELQQYIQFILNKLIEIKNELNEYLV